MDEIYDIAFLNTTCNYDNIIEGGGQVIENISDGTVSVFINDNGNLTPFVLGKFCCENIKTEYFWDADNQQCRWTEKTNTLCGLNNPFKIVLNSDGNDGTLYIPNENEVCGLEVDLNYLIKVKCETLNNILNPTILTSPQNDITLEQISVLENQIEIKTQECNQINNNVIYFQDLVLSTDYSIECEGQIYCLTEDGLNSWASLLGPIRYDSFLLGNPTSYTCLDVTLLLNENQSNIVNSLPNLVVICTVPFGTKTDYINQLNVLLIDQINCNNALNALTTEVESLRADLETSSIGCSTPIEFFETFDISLSIDIVNLDDTLFTVYEEPLFPVIGVGNLYTYLVQQSEFTPTFNSGFYVCGDPSLTETTFSPCSPLIFDFDSINDLNVSSCELVMNNLLTSLYNESELSGTTDGQNVFRNTLPTNSLSSDWVNYNLTITDETIINQILNKKVKISFKINNSCADFCLLVDDIKLNKICSVVTETNILLTKSPGFELERIIDNKKSWVSNDTLENRSFVISDNNNNKNNNIRNTNYNVDNERLIINSKEIDLDLNVAAAIDADVWGYLNDNPCILTATTTFNCPCTGLTLETCCGDESSIDFSSLLSKPVSEINTIEEFQTIFISNLIDAKNRQTISAYPTLKALYNRYLNSTAYCETASSAFDYSKIEYFVNLVENYWVDIVEQVIPSTTIWGSAKVYTNTIFDQQKFKYRSYTTLLCGNPYYGQTINSPINGTNGVSHTIDVSMQPISLPSDELITNNPITYCGSLSIAQMNVGSEFIGSVNIIQN